MDNDIILALIGGGVTVIVALINKDKICKCVNLCPVENMESQVEERNDVRVCNTNTPFMCNGEILLCTRCNTHYCSYHHCVNKSIFRKGGHDCPGA